MSVTKHFTKPKILVMSWVGQGDFGDEVMAFVLRKFLKMHGADEITYYHLGQYPIHKDIDDLKISSLYSFDTKGLIKSILNLWHLRRFNISISGGGSILHSINSIKWRLDVINKLSKNKNFNFAAAVGVSIGPFNNNCEEHVCSDFLKGNKLVILRDNYSAKLANKLCNSSEIFASLDTSVLLPKICSKQWNEILARPRDQNTVGVMLIQKKGEEVIFKANHHLEKYLQIIDNLTAKGKKIILFNLYIGSQYPDIKLNEILKRQAAQPDQIEIHSFSGDIFTTTEQINRCGYIVSMRLHGIIFSYLLRIPFLSLSYNRKNNDFCESIGYPTSYSFDFYAQNDMKRILTALDDLLENGSDPFSTTIELPRASELVERNLSRLTDRIQIF
jgi:polysaccharide pyruvyl transferase WcaK-like protein